MRCMGVPSPRKRGRRLAMKNRDDKSRGHGREAPDARSGVWGAPASAHGVTRRRCDRLEPTVESGS